MHTVTVTTTTPDGQILYLDTIVTTGPRAEALAAATALARRVTINIHAADPCQHHAHLIDLGDEPHTVISPHITAAGRTDLFATLNAANHIA